MRKFLAAALALVMILSLSIPAFAAGATYSDVTDGLWYSEAVKYVTLGGLMEGAGGGKFDPNGTATRAEIAEALYRLVGSPKVSLANLSYTDVSASDPHAAAIIWAKENNIMGGIGGGQFGPNGTLNRETMATILYRVSRYAGKDLNSRADLAKYTDSQQISAWAKNEFAWAVAEGVFNGTSTTTLSPQQATPRSQIAALVQRTGENVLDVTYPDDGSFVYAVPASEPAPEPQPAATYDPNKMGEEYTKQDLLDFTEIEFQKFNAVAEKNGYRLTWSSKPFRVIEGPYGVFFDYTFTGNRYRAEINGIHSPAPGAPGIGSTYHVKVYESSALVDKSARVTGGNLSEVIEILSRNAN